MKGGLQRTSKDLAAAIWGLFMLFVALLPHRRITWFSFFTSRALPERINRILESCESLVTVVDFNHCTINL